QWDRFLAEGLFGSGEATASVRTALASAVSKAPEARRNIEDLALNEPLDVLGGDFGAAREKLRVWSDRIATSEDELDHWTWLMESVSLALELGRRDEA